jgi:hypothetical protein
MVDLRRYGRVGFLGRLELTAPRGEPQLARSLDLSLGGVRAITKSTFSMGEVITVAFILKDEAHCEVRYEVHGRIVRLRADVDANTVGIQFLKPLNDVEHPRLVGKLMSI